MDRGNPSALVVLLRIAEKLTLLPPLIFSRTSFLKFELNIQLLNKAFSLLKKIPIFKLLLGSSFATLFHLTDKLAEEQSLGKGI